MNLAEFVESLILDRFGSIPIGHVRMNPGVHPEIPPNIGDVRQIGFVGGVRFYVDPGIPEDQVRFIDADGRITILLPKLPKGDEVDEKPAAEKPRKRKSPKKRKARPIRSRSSKVD